MAYLDDIIVVGESFEDHVANLSQVVKRISDANLKLNPEKCIFFLKRREILGTCG